MSEAERSNGIGRSYNQPSLWQVKERIELLIELIERNMENTESMQEQIRLLNEKLDEIKRIVISL